MVKRANPAELRKALEIAQSLAKAGIMFVPMPVLNSYDLKNLTEQSALKFNLMLAEPPKGQPQRPEGEYPLSALIFKRGEEWVLELSGSINNCDFTCRHTEPISTAPEDVAGLPLLYAKAAQAPVAVPQGRKLVPVCMSQAMRDVTDTEGWAWEDLLAAAEAITEDEHAMLATAPQPPEQQVKATEGGAG